MADKPTYEELERRVVALKAELSRSRQAETELGIFRRLAEAAGYAFGMADIDGNIKYANKALCVMLGEDRPEDAYGKNVVNYYPESARDELVKVILPTVTEEGQWIGDLPLLSIKGHETQTIQNIFVVHSDGEAPPFLANLLIDISHRRQVDQALREALEFRERIISESSVGIAIYDATGNCLDANASLAELIGATREQVLEQNYNGIESWKKCGLLDQARSVMAEGTKRRFEFEVRTSFGKDVSMDCHLVPFSSEGKPHLLLMVNDISETKALRAQLQRAEKMEAIGALAGGVAHDLNNILSGLVSYPDLILMDLPDDSPLREPILTIEESGKRAASIVQDLLTLARRGVPVTEVVDINSVIDEYLASPEHRRLRAVCPGVRFQRCLQDGLLNVQGSPVHLSKTIMNLVSNAAESVDLGGEVTISTRNQYVDRPIRGYDEVKEGDYVVLEVTDNGKGISAQDREKLFEPFYTRKVMGRSGTGLGLAVVWGTVKDHNGYIDVNSTVGEGSAFELYFPATREDLERGTSLNIEDYMGRGERVLVVDDVQKQREIASALLTKLGYVVEVVASGEEAITYLKEHAADLLVLDMIMDPGIDGLDTYREVLEWHPGQKAIITSGYAETDRVREAQELGAGEYVKKPYTLERIGMAAKSALHK